MIERHFPIYNFDPVPGPLDGVTWYAEKGMTKVGDIPLMFYKVPKWKKIAVACPLEKFKGTMITGKNLQDAVDQWMKVYQSTPQTL